MPRTRFWGTRGSGNHVDALPDALTDYCVGTLFKTERFDAAAFGAVEAHPGHKAERLRFESALSKRIPQAQRPAVGAIRSRAEYRPDVRAHPGRANAFDLMLDRGIAGETRSDRGPAIRIP